MSRLMFATENKVELTKRYGSIYVKLYGPGLRHLKKVPENTPIDFNFDGDTVVIKTQEVVIPSMTITCKAQGNTTRRDGEECQL